MLAGKGDGANAACLNGLYSMLAWRSCAEAAPRSKDIPAAASRSTRTKRGTKFALSMPQKWVALWSPSTVLAAASLTCHMASLLPSLFRSLFELRPSDESHLRHTGRIFSLDNDHRWQISVSCCRISAGVSCAPIEALGVSYVFRGDSAWSQSQ